MIHVIDNLDTVSDQELVAKMAELPSWRYIKAMQYHFAKDRKLCTFSYLLLRDILQQEYGLQGDFQFSYTSMGKPFLSKYPSLHFNLSHSKEVVACVVNSKMEVGIDVECIESSSLDLDLMKMVMSKNEINEIISNPLPKVRFIELWTQKESLLKCTGQGLPHSTDELLRLSQQFANFVFDTTVCLEKGYIVTTCLPRFHSNE